MTSVPSPVRVWRLATFGRTIGVIVAAGPALIALALWVQTAVHPSVARAFAAAVPTGIAAVYGILIWWFALRPQLVLTEDEVVVVNPWGTQRLPVGEVIGVTGGMWGGRLLLRDGWSVTCFVLSGMYGGQPDRGRRIAEVADAVTERRRALGVR